MFFLNPEKFIWVEPICRLFMGGGFDLSFSGDRNYGPGKKITQKNWQLPEFERNNKVAPILRKKVFAVPTEKKRAVYEDCAIAEINVCNSFGSLRIEKWLENRKWYSMCGLIDDDKMEKLINITRHRTSLWYCKYRIRELFSILKHLGEWSTFNSFSEFTRKNNETQLDQWSNATKTTYLNKNKENRRVQMDRLQTLKRGKSPGEKGNGSLLRTPKVNLHRKKAILCHL